MKKKEIPWRLIANSGDIYYKLCSFWGWNKDATLNFKLYSKNKSKIFEVHGVKEERFENNDGTTTVQHHVTYDKITPTDFHPNKSTFHPSGFLHTTDNSGEKHKLGIRSLPFDEIETFRQLMMIFPKKYEEFPTIDKGHLRDGDVVFDLNIFDHDPFQIEVFLVRGDRVPKIYPRVPVDHTKSVDIFCGDNSGNSCKYLLFVRCSQTRGMLKQKFPPQTYMVKMVLNHINDTEDN